MNNKKGWIILAVFVILVVAGSIYFMSTIDTDYTTEEEPGIVTTASSVMEGGGVVPASEISVPSCKRAFDAGDQNAEIDAYCAEGNTMETCANDATRSEFCYWDPGVEPAGYDCHMRGDEEWCCYDDGYTYCGGDTCGPSQAWCDNWNNKIKHCDYYDRPDFCCNEGGAIYDYRKDRCCNPEQPFMFTDHSGGNWCYSYPVKGGDSLIADNYITRQAPCDKTISMCWPEGQCYDEFIEDTCSGTDYQTCQSSGSGEAWSSSWDNQGGVIGQCGYVDLCASKTCENTCQGNFKLFNGQCAQGNCIYDSVSCDTANFCEGDIIKGGGSCQSGQCVPSTIEDCSQKQDYCYGSVKYYDSGCNAGSCEYNTQECNKPAWCDGTKLWNYDKCESGNCQYTSTECAAGDICVGDVRRFDNRCETGGCTYAEQTCPFGCDNGECKQDPCSGEVCGDGYCNSECQENLQSCATDCDPCYSKTCGDGVCDDACGEDLDSCFNDCAECGITTTSEEDDDNRECETGDGKEGSQQCVGGVWEECEKKSNLIPIAVYSTGILTLLGSLAFLIFRKKN